MSYLGPLVYLVVLAVLACFLVYYRETCIDRSQRIEQLEDAVQKLTQTNLGYQNYASEASAREEIERFLEALKNIVIKRIA